MIKQKIKDFVLKIGIRNNFHKMPYWMIALLIIIFFISLYSVYFDIHNYLGTYGGCSDCSK
ncbi:MAG: hypothetical protein AB1637_08925 [Elusimicrobiota bacterium]